MSYSIVTGSPGPLRQQATLRVPPAIPTEKAFPSPHEKLESRNDETRMHAGALLEFKSQLAARKAKTMSRVTPRRGSTPRPSSAPPSRPKEMAPQGGYEAAAKRMSYRSEGQRYTDHRQATGFDCRGPVSFGQHEVGRGSMPKHCNPMAIFKHEAGAAKRDVLHPHMDGFNRIETSDPGAYRAQDASPHRSNPTHTALVPTALPSLLLNS